MKVSFQAFTLRVLPSLSLSTLCAHGLLPSFATTVIDISVRCARRSKLVPDFMHLLHTLLPLTLSPASISCNLCCPDSESGGCHRSQVNYNLYVCVPALYSPISIVS
jgi:hypothetical protein